MPRGGGTSHLRNTVTSSSGRASAHPIKEEKTRGSLLFDLYRGSTNLAAALLLSGGDEEP